MVTLPDAKTERDRGYQERIVFFGAPRTSGGFIYNIRILATI
ncbi:hypothetical protein PPGU19_102160 (plasmid) [Paraburkholderia sp. PGU19]|nr:hypothetical protein PPGU19_102160 [Paraburkholderia sp. PGU19]